MDSFLLLLVYGNTYFLPSHICRAMTYALWNGSPVSSRLSDSKHPVHVIVTLKLVVAELLSQTFLQGKRPCGGWTSMSLNLLSAATKAEKAINHIWGGAPKQNEGEA